MSCSQTFVRLWTCKVKIGMQVVVSISTFTTRQYGEERSRNPDGTSWYDDAA
jgi:hypothetical protein